MIKKRSAYSTLAKKFNLLVDAPLSGYTSFRVGGPADLLALPCDLNELKPLLKQAMALDIPVTLFGGGTNLLITDKGIRGLVVVTKHLKSKIHVTRTDPDNSIVHVQAGDRLSSVCHFTLTQGLSGLEFAAGIPGTIGGAIMMNAGTPSRNMAAIVEAIEVMNPQTLDIQTIQRKNLDFSYRHLHQDGFLVAADLTLTRADSKKIETAFNQNLRNKTASQPVSAASAGCFFKNPDQGRSAGELIEQSGLKGLRINDAMVSEHHANYIVNLNHATCEDILTLKQRIQETVFNRYQIKLETEVRIKGE